MSTVIATEWFGSMGPGIAVGALTVVILIFGEITPKSLATRYSERISLFIAPLLHGLMRLIFPLVWFFGQFTTWIYEITGVHRDPMVTESELISMAGHGVEEGTIEHDERQMIERVFNFHDICAGDVMTPRSRVFALPSTLTVAEALPEARRWRYTRIPIFEELPDEIRKVVYLRDILDACAEGNIDTVLRKISHDPLFVPENQPIDELFTELRSKKRRLAVVVDEYGLVQGIVTLEDLLEELVGEIYDESDKPEGIERLGKTKIAVDGIVELRMVEDFFGVKLTGKPTDKVSLWVLSHAERIPDKDEKFLIDGLSVIVAKASERHIRRVIISQPKENKLK
jgi:CBS domain containing-hemolysin-like protein